MRTVSLSWALYADNAGEPAAEPSFTHITVPSDSLDDDKTIFEVLVHPGFPLAPDTKYWAVLRASPLIEGEEPTFGLAGISEWGDIVILDGPAAELDPGSESGWTLDFSTLASPADPMSTEEWVTFAAELELEPNGKLVLRMSVLTYPEVTASFGQESHTVAEGATQSVTVTLSADPERTVTIPIVTMVQDGASSVDYAGVPDSVTFNAGGPTEMKFTFTATQDTVGAPQSARRPPPTSRLPEASPGHRACNSLTPLPLSSRRPSVDSGLTERSGSKLKGQVLVVLRFN